MERSVLGAAVVRRHGEPDVTASGSTVGLYPLERPCSGYPCTSSMVATRVAEERPADWDASSSSDSGGGVRQL